MIRRQVDCNKACERAEQERAGSRLSSSVNHTVLNAGESVQGLGKITIFKQHQRQKHCHCTIEEGVDDRPSHIGVRHY